MKLVSVIITTYNRFNLLCRAIDSVLSQTYKNIEIIVVDDCSNDGTDTLICRYLNSVKYIRNQKNIGLPASRNVGIMSSIGDYVSFLDDDDSLLPEKIQLQVDAFGKNPELGAMYCGSFRRYEHVEFSLLPNLRGIIYPEVLNSSPNAIHTLLISRNCLELTGCFDESLAHLEDFDFWIRLSKCCIFDYVPECLVVYNIHKDQMSTNYLTAISGRDIILKKHSIDFRKNKKYLYMNLSRQASKSAIIGDYSAFYKYLFMAIKASPFVLSSYVHLFLSVISRCFHKKLISKYGVKTIDGVTRF